MDILQNMGCDMRVLQIEGAKDPDEYVVKYGPERFQKCVDNAISLVEFKVKVLKKELNLEHTNDKIKFLNEIAKILAKISNQMEREIYIDKISKEYSISKEAIGSEIQKLLYARSQGAKTLEKTKKILSMTPEGSQTTIDSATLKRENMLLYLIINYPQKAYLTFQAIVKPQDMKDERNQQILKKLYEELEKGNINTNQVLNWFESQEMINHLTEIMTYEFEMTDIQKAIEDIVMAFQKEKLTNRKNEIIQQLENTEGLNSEKIKQLEDELNEVILQLVKIK